MMGSYAQVSSTGWVVLVQVPLAVLYGALLKAAVPITYLCLVIWGIMSLTFRQRFWKYVVTPLTDLSKTAIAISSGDLERTAKVESEDEIGIVAKAFNSMTTQLREVISRLEERVDQLTRTREKLKTHQEKLESLVEERTEALTERTHCSNLSSPLNSSA